MQFLCKPVTLRNVFIGIFLECFCLGKANLFENVPLTTRLDGAVPPVVLELFLAVRHRQPFCLSQSLGKARVATTLVVLLACAVEDLARTRFRHRSVQCHNNVFVV